MRHRYLEVDKKRECDKAIEIQLEDVIKRETVGGCDTARERNS